MLESANAGDHSLPSKLLFSWYHGFSYLFDNFFLVPVLAFPRQPPSPALRFGAPGVPSWPYTAVSLTVAAPTSFRQLAPGLGAQTPVLAAAISQPEPTHSLSKRTVLSCLHHLSRFCLLSEAPSLPA